MTSLTMSGDQVVIRFAQAEQAFQAAAAKHQMNCVAAERQCRAYIASQSSLNFTVDSISLLTAVCRL